jgi:predicted nucleic acid-binding protein
VVAGPPDAADPVIATTALRTDARLLTCSIRHFPMFPDLVTPY